MTLDTDFENLVEENGDTMETMEIALDLLRLDFLNPRFSVFNFKTEEEVIDYLKKFEQLDALVNSINAYGYQTLGERIIVIKDEDDCYIVLEGNRRVAALKEIHVGSLRTFTVPADIVLDREDALFKIASKHIASIKEWSPVEKRAFYSNQFEAAKKKGKKAKDALKHIASFSPETVATIKKDIQHFYFIMDVYEEYRKKYGKQLPELKTDILATRIYTPLMKRLQLKVDNKTLRLTLPEKEQSVQLYKNILFTLGELVWESGEINTRTLKNSEFDDTIATKFPKLDKLIIRFLEAEYEEHISEISAEDSTHISEISAEDSTHNQIDKTSYNQSVEVESDVGIQMEEVTEKESERANNNLDRADGKKESEKPKIQLKIIEPNVYVTALPYALKSNVELFVNGKKHKLSSVCFESDNSTVTTDIIELGTSNGIIHVIAKYKGLKKSFDVTIAVNSTPNIAPIIEQKWASEQIQVLSRNDDNKKIINCIQFLSEINYQEELNFIACSAALRSLMEFSIKRFEMNKGTKNDNEIENINVPSSLIQISNNINKDSRAKRKEIKVLDDNYQMLNTYLHHPTIKMVSTDLKNCFNRVMGVLEHIYKSISGIH